MPFLRFSRDKRGYENTYLCHTFRRGGAPQLRVLYWFRTPPNIEVGRLALDPDAIRAIEASNPDLTFDWAQILKVKPPPPDPDQTRDGRSERHPGWRRGRSGPAESAPASAEASRSARAGPELERTEAVDWRDPGAEVGVDQPTGNSQSHVVLKVTDAEGLARLRARYAEMQTRIDDRPREPAQREALCAQAALLDPDAWSSVDEARERLASLEETTETLRKVLSARRRTRRGGARRRRRRAGDGSPDHAAEPSGPDGESSSGAQQAPPGDAAESDPD